MGARGSGRSLHEAIRNDLAADLTRRELIARAGRIGAGLAIASALPLVSRMSSAPPAEAQIALLDGTLQAFYDTVIPGRRVARTELGNPIDHRAIAGVDPEPGAVEADALALGRRPELGFNVLEAAFHADLAARALLRGGLFLDLDYGARERVCVDGLAFRNPLRIIWEAAAAIPFTAFCAAGSIPNATDRTSVGYAVMGHPGTAPHGYDDSSYGVPLSSGRTAHGNLP